MTRLLITGASGFIGTAVVEAALGAGYEVTTLGRSHSAVADGPTPRQKALDSETITGDFLHPPSWRAAVSALRPDACIHLAWCTTPDQYLHAIDNVAFLNASVALARCLFDSGCHHMIGVGSCAEYATDDAILGEGSRTDPRTLYAASKLSLGLIGAQLAHQAGATFTWARLFYVYGSGERAPRVIAAAIRTLLDGRDFAAGTGEQVRDYLHVDDVAAALVRMVERPVDGVVNVGSGGGVTVRHVLELVGRQIGPPATVKFGVLPARSWDPPRVVADVSRLRAVGWEPRFSLETGIADTIARMRVRVRVRDGIHSPVTGS